MKDIKMTQIKLLMMKATIHQWQQDKICSEFRGAWGSSISRVSMGGQKIEKNAVRWKIYWIDLMKDQTLHKKKLSELEDTAIGNETQRPKTLEKN